MAAFKWNVKRAACPGEQRNFETREEAVIRTALVLGYEEGSDFATVDLGEQGLVFYPKNGDPIINAVAVIREIV